MPFDVICAVCVRTSKSGIEYCLSAPMGTTRWSFYNFELDGNLHLDRVTSKVETELGLRLKPIQDQPISLLSPSRNVPAGKMISFGYFTHEESDTWPGRHLLRRRWCLAEEARYRLRRKPLQRLVDLLEHEYRDQISTLAGSIGVPGMGE